MYQFPAITCARQDTPVIVYVWDINHISLAGPEEFSIAMIRKTCQDMHCAMFSLLYPVW